MWRTLGLIEPSNEALFRKWSILQWVNILHNSNQNSKPSFDEISVTNNDLLRIRDLVLNDSVALGKWSLIVDHIVQSPADVLEVKDLLRWHKYGEAVLQSLRLCSVDLVQILRQNGLNSLAGKYGRWFLLGVTQKGLLIVSNFFEDKIIERKLGTTRSTWCSGFWFDVKKPVDLFTGRREELADVHSKIQRSSGKLTVISQMTSISGLGGIGKTASKAIH